MITINIIGVSGAILASTVVEGMSVLECQEIGFSALQGLKRFGGVFTGARVELG